MIIVRLSGGMGNQMFQYALGRKLALEYDVSLKLDTTFLLHRISVPQILRPHFVFRNYDLDVFNITATIADKKDMKWWQRPMLFGKCMIFIDAVLRKIPILRGWEKGFIFDKKVLTLGPDAYLAGFWQSPKYFTSIRETLLKDFTLINPLSGQTELLLKEIENKQSLCIHVRRADIANKSFHGAASEEYYQRAAAYMQEHASVEKAYVFSDDIEWCREHLQFPFETVFVGQEHAGKKGEGHMELMRHCKHFIIPNSTFSWWAAWLSDSENKIVIAPQKWFNDATINTNDLIPPEWVRL